MPNGPLDAGSSIPKGDNAESSSIGGSSNDAQQNLFEDSYKDLAQSNDSGSGAFNDGNTELDLQEPIDGSENIQEGDASDQVQVTDAGDNLKMEDIAGKAAQHLGNAGEKLNKLQGTEMEESANDMLKFFGEDLANSGLGEDAAKMGAMVAAGNLSGLGQAAKTLGKAGIPKNKE